MLVELKSLHSELLDLLARMEALTAEHFDEHAVADARWKLTRASNRRRRFLEEVVYPHLLARISPGEALRIKDLQGNAGASRAASSAHIRHWTPEHIARDWTGYQRASNAMRASMRERIAKEKSVIYPLLERNRD